MQIALVCMLIAKASSLEVSQAAYLYSATFPVLVLLCLTIIASNFIESLYFPKSQFLPLNKALDIDQKNYENKSLNFEKFVDAYMQPELKKSRDCSLDTSTTDSTLIFQNFLNYTNLDDETDCSSDTSTTDSTLISQNFFNYTNLDDESKQEKTMK